MAIDWNNLFDFDQFLFELLRLGGAALLGSIIGLERHVHGHWAGIRTHIAVSLGAAAYTLAALGVAPAPLPDATRVIQGIAAGIGFLGAGTILKLSDKLEVKGLTTASSIWLAAAVGTSVGLGRFSLAVGTTLISLLVLGALRPFAKNLPEKNEDQ